MDDFMRPFFGLQECRERRRPTRQRTGGCWNCPYKDQREREECIIQLQDDLKKLIRRMNGELDPVEPDAKKLYENERVIAVNYYCGSCRIGISREDEACPCCGRRVKWN